MNWLGKVFVVVILIMSLVFMGLSMAVYATHKNWKVVSEGLAEQVAKAKAQNSKDKTDYEHRLEDLDREKTAAVQQAAKSETERVVMADRNLQLQTQVDTLTQNQREHIAAVASTQAINVNLKDEVIGLRGKIKDEQVKRDLAFKTALDATEKVHKEAADLENALQQNQQLTKEVAGMTTVMREKGIDPATEPGSVVPTVEGVVSRIERKDGGQFVEVSIGADDGLKTGNTLEVSRGGKYLGRVDIIETSPDKSVGRVDRKFQTGMIQEGDRVATRIKL